MLCSEYNTFSRTVSRSVTINCIGTCYNQVKKNVARSNGSGKAWAKKSDGSKASIAGLNQLLSDKTVSTLKRTAVLAFPVHVSLLNVFVQRKYLMIDITHMLGGLLSVRYGDEKLEEKRSEEVDDMSFMELHFL